MPALSRARWPYTNTQWIEASDVCNYSEAFFDYALLMGGEDQVFEVAAMVRKIVWAPQLSYSFCNFEAHGHLDTVHGLGRVVKQRNDVCTKCYRSSTFSYELWELWLRPSPIDPPCPGGTWCDCMKSMSALSLRGCCVATCECFPTPDFVVWVRGIRTGWARAIGCGVSLPHFLCFSSIRYPP